MQYAQNMLKICNMRYDQDMLRICNMQYAQDMRYAICNMLRIWICDMQYAQDMREADQEFVRSAMQKIEEETCLRFKEQEGV